MHSMTIDCGKPFYEVRVLLPEDLILYTNKQRPAALFGYNE